MHSLESWGRDGVYGGLLCHAVCINPPPNLVNIASGKFLITYHLLNRSGVPYLTKLSVVGSSLSVKTAQLLGCLCLISLGYVECA